MSMLQRVSKADLIELSALYEELTGKKTDLHKLRENFRWINANPDYLLLGAKKDGVLVGSLLAILCHDVVGDCRPFMVLENVIVKSEYRGSGIGKQLMLYIEDNAREKDCSYIFFVSSAERQNAHRFYESLGYRPDAVRGFKKYL